MLIDLIAGARPNFMKIAPIIDAIHIAQQSKNEINYRLIHTGQHYDDNMSDSFFQQLGIPPPHHNLRCGGGSQAEQTAAIMIGYEKILMERRSDLCLVVGDVNSTLSCAITAQKMHVKVAHVEAGIRSNDWTMPEEINRLLTDSITNYFFTTSETSIENLCKSGVEERRIFFVGNTMIDTLLKNRPRFRAPAFYEQLGLQEGEYFVMTLHRPANVDEESKFKLLMKTILRNSQNLPIIFPVHPRTAKIIKLLLESDVDFDTNHLHVVEPLGYLEFNYLVEHAKAVITDSGGVTEETTVLGVPCMTLRDNTERPETVTIGTNELLGTNPETIKCALEKLFCGKWKKGKIPEFWDGKSAQRIVKHLLSINLKI
jgi:UDP-N-acetylglucosamine 2-epimerase (non-hydrolysing)